MYVFGTRSREQLNTCHQDLVRIMELAIKITNVDFGIHQGARTIEQQQEYYNNGKSKINPKKYESKEALAEVAKHIVLPEVHIYSKSRALDLHVAEKYNGKRLTWDDNHLCYLAGTIIACADMLYKTGQVSHLNSLGS